MKNLLVFAWKQVFMLKYFRPLKVWRAGRAGDLAFALSYYFLNCLAWSSRRVNVRCCWRLGHLAVFSRCKHLPDLPEIPSNWHKRDIVTIWVANLWWLREKRNETDVRVCYFTMNLYFRSSAFPLMTYALYQRRVKCLHDWLPRLRLFCRTNRTDSRKLLSISLLFPVALLAQYSQKELYISYFIVEKEHFQQLKNNNRYSGGLASMSLSIIIHMEHLPWRIGKRCTRVQDVFKWLACLISNLLS